MNLTAINGQGINNRDAFIKRIASAPGHHGDAIDSALTATSCRWSAKVEEYFESGP